MSVPAVRRGDPSEWRVDDRGAGDVLVLVHGLGTDASGWDRLAPELSRAHRVVTVDLPGYSLRTTAEQVPTAEDLAAGLQRVLERVGVESAVFIGHSFGGAVCLLVAHDVPTMCAGLILIAPGGFGAELNPVVQLMGTRAGARMLGALYGPRASRAIERIAHRVERRSSDDRLRIAELMETYDRLRTEQAREQFRSSVRESLALSAHIDRTQIAVNSRIPIRVLWGTEDRVLPSWQAKNVTSMLPWSTVRLLPGAGHTPHRSQPAVVLGEIDLFVESGKVQRRLAEPRA